MKIISTLSAVLILLLIVGCSENPKETAKDAARHERSALSYQNQGQLRAAMLEARNAIQLQPESPSGYITLANIYNQVGAYSSTQKLLEPVQETMPQVGLELAEAYVATKKQRSALNLLNKHPASATEPAEQLRLLSLRARAYIALGDKSGYEKNLQALRDLASTEPRATAEADYVEASYLLSQGQSEAASKALESLLEQSPEHLKALILLSEIKIYSNQLQQAEALLTRALTLTINADVMTADRSMVLSHLTQALIQLGRTSEAYTYQKLLSDANPESYNAQQKFSEAMELYQQGKFVEAEVLLKEIHELFPSDKNTGTLLGLVQYQQGDDEEALDLFDQYIDPETAGSSVIQAAAIAKYRTNKIDEAIALLKAAVENQPMDANIQATYGLALLDRDATSNEGALALEKSLAINPEQQRLRIALAKRYIAMENKVQALAQLQTAYKQQPLDLAIQQTYFKALLSEGQDEQVSKYIADFQTTYPDNPRGQLLQGLLKLHQKDYKAAQQAFEKSLAASNNEEKAMSYGGLAQAFELDNQLEKAASTWQNAIQDDPTETLAYSRWLAVLQKINKLDSAKTVLQKLESEGEHWQPSVVLAQLLFNQKDIDKAIEHIDVALVRSSNHEVVTRTAANLYNQRGLELRARQQLNEARTDLLKALELSPNNIAYLASIIDIELSTQNIPEAQKLLDQFPQSEENTAAHLFIQAVIHKADNKPNEAIKFYRQSWAARPTDNSGEAIYAHFQAADQKAEAESHLEDWLQKIPESPRPTLIKAIALHQKNDIEGAIYWYEKTVELAPNMAAAINNLAWIYYEQDHPDALKLAARAYELAPNSPPVLDTYGWILVEQGKVEEGFQYLERAAKGDPDNEDIKKHVQEAKARMK